VQREAGMTEPNDHTADPIGPEVPIDKVEDASGLACPLPILRAKKALSGMPSGAVLKLIATDPGSVRDFQAFARQTGNTLLSQEERDGVWTHLLRRR